MTRLRILGDRFASFTMELRSKPYAVASTVFIILGVCLFAYQVVRPIDVLVDWKVTTSLQGRDGSLPVYFASESLEFKSTSRKVADADGITTRIVDCDATGQQPPREIQLDVLQANREPGFNPPRENSITVPNVTEFRSLPRTCRIRFNICYQNVVLWRDHCERADSNDFIVEQRELDAAALEAEIKRLNAEVEDLKSQRSAIGTSQSRTSTAPSAPQQQTTIIREQAPQQSAPAPTPQPQPATPREITGIPLLDRVIRTLGL